MWRLPRPARPLGALVAPLRSGCVWPESEPHLCPLVRLIGTLLQRVQLHRARLKLELRNLQALLQLHHLRGGASEGGAAWN